jgi:DNA-binding transcriptional ArsR family regulator
MDRGPEDLVWRALASPHRRRILDLLRSGPCTTGDIAEHLPDVGRHAAMQHLSVLVEAGLVLANREGTRRWNSLNVVPLKRALERWVTPFQALWAGRLEDIKRRAEQTATTTRGRRRAGGRH